MTVISLSRVDEHGVEHPMKFADLCPMSVDGLTESSADPVKVRFTYEYLNQYLNPLRTFMMIDIESLGLRVGSPILSIGGCAVIPGHGVSHEFYMNLDLGEQLRAGARVEADAFHWWMKQSDDARLGLTEGPFFTLLEARRALCSWWIDVSNSVFVDSDHMYAMALGNDFDLAQIDYWFQGDVPWHYRKKTCLRALVNTHPNSVVWDNDSKDAKHNALADATSQGRMLLRMIEEHPYIAEVEGE